MSWWNFASQILSTLGLDKKEDASKKSPPNFRETIKSRNFYTNNLENHKKRENNETESQNITRRMDSADDYELSDQAAEEDKSEPEYYYYYYYDYMDSGIDISHELSTYEPLPTPLPLEDVVTPDKEADVTEWIKEYLIWSENVINTWNTSAILILLWCWLF